MVDCESAFLRTMSSITGKIIAPLRKIYFSASIILYNIKKLVLLMIWNSSRGLFSFGVKSIFELIIFGISIRDFFRSQGLYSSSDGSEFCPQFPGWNSAILFLFWILTLSIELKYFALLNTLRIFNFAAFDLSDLDI